jgi:hypothetical protein
MELKIGEYLKLGRVCFKIKEASNHKHISGLDNIKHSSVSSSQIENTNALISDEDEDMPDEQNMNQSKIVLLMCRS